jgi:hypothetical protein
MARSHRLPSVLSVSGWTRVVLTGLAVAFSSGSALAAEVLVAPLVSSNLKSDQVVNITGLVAWELEFAGDFDIVNQLPSRPSSLTARCLSSSSCLGSIARSEGASAMVTGAATGKSGKVDLYLVLFRDGKIERSKEFTVQNDSSAIADAMGGFVGELLSGESPVAAAESSVIGGDLVADADMFGDEEDDEDDFSISRRIPTPSSGGGDVYDDFDDFDDGEEERRAAEEAERLRREEEDARRAAEERARREREAEEDRRREEDEARRRQEEEDRLRRESEARMAAEDEARRREERLAAFAAQEARAAAEPDEDDDYFDDYDSFDDDDDVRSDDDRGGGYSSSRSSGSSSSYDDFDDDYDDRRGSFDLDDQDSSSRSSRSSSSRSSSSTSSRSSTRYEPSGSDNSSSLAVRMGFSSFQGLSFLTYGAEANFKVSDRLGLVAGIEAYSTQREIPDALRQDDEPEVQWNTILPFNIGGQYLMGSGRIQPYAGADLQFIPGYVKGATGLAVGLRARGGLNYLVSDGFGLNMNLSAGFWSGKNFDTVARDFSNAAGVPQISAGAVVLF